MSTVFDYSEAASKLPNAYFLGQVVSFTITEADVNLEELRDNIASHGLRTEILKGSLRRIDAFKKAANEIGCKFQKHGNSQSTILVRAVGQDTDESHRHVVLERAFAQSGQPRRVQYDTIYKLRYSRGERDKETNEVKGDFIDVERQNTESMLSQEERKWLSSTLGTDGVALLDRFEHLSTHLDSHGVRAFVREYLLALGAINIKGNGGGLYFVQQKHVAELRALTALVKAVGSQMHLIPLLDIIDQRDMLAEAFVSDTLDEVRSLSQEMDKILTGADRTISEKTYDQWAAKAAGLINKSQDYASLLDRSLEVADSELRVFKLRTLKLADRIRQPQKMSK